MPAFWDDLQQAVYEDRVIEATYEHYRGDIVERVLEPYSLVNKSSNWYLIARRDDTFRTYRVTRFHQVRLLDQRFTRHPDYDLPGYWQEHLQEFVDSFSEYRCTLRIHPDREAFVKWLVPGRWEIVGHADEDGWLTLNLMMDSPLLAKMLVFGLGTAGQVVAPDELRAAVLNDARTLLQHYDCAEGEA